MPINLIADPWLPARRLQGAREWIRPADITSGFDDDFANPILALDFPRPDWNVAVAELLIGLLACAMAPEDTGGWAKVWASPPSPDELADRLAPLAFAFNLGGGGPRCFQDFDGLEDGDETPVSALLIDAPSEDSTSNTDLFIKQGLIPALSPPFAAAALVTMQTYAPEGGRGHLASMRGGGPMTTLAVLRRKVNDLAITTLWDLVWANVPAQDWAGELPSGPSSLSATEWSRIFPWLAPTLSYAKGRLVLQEPDIAHNLQCFFGLPRRVRLDFVAVEGQRCALDGPNGDVAVRTYRRRPHGVKYEGWTHPLSPYRALAGGGKTAFHPQPGGATYHDWLSWLINPEDRKTECARSIAFWGERLKSARGRAEFAGNVGVRTWQSGVLACGFDMKKMKARGWLEARIPYFDPPPGEDSARWSKVFTDTVRLLVAGAEEAGSALRYRLRLAKFGACDREKGSYSLPKMSPGKNAYEDVYESFWRETEPDFRTALEKLREAPEDTSRDIRTAFCKALRAKALTLFDEAAGTDNLADQDARRIVAARSGLAFAFGETGSVRKALDILTQAARQNAAGRKARKKEAAA